MTDYYGHIAVARLHRGMRRTPYVANRVRSLLNHMFKLATIEWQVRSDNPVTGVAKFPEEPRERYLTHDELARLLHVLPLGTNEASANVVRICILSGARSASEVMNATWKQFDLDAGVWTKPKSTKQKKIHRVRLSEAAQELLHKMRDEASPDAVFLFPSRSKVGHLTTIKKAWARWREAANIPDVRVHDLRHTYASMLVSQGETLPVIGALLGHTQPATTARYAHLYDEPLAFGDQQGGRRLQSR